MNSRRHERFVCVCVCVCVCVAEKMASFLRALCIAYSVRRLIVLHLAVTNISRFEYQHLLRMQT
jgi:hypothetical protein